MCDPIIRFPALIISSKKKSMLIFESKLWEFKYENNDKFFILSVFHFLAASAWRKEHL
jgi:hypothetical protein